MGQASITLEAGIYDVRFLNLSGRGEITIQVPSSGTVTLVSIITSTTPGFFSTLPSITSTQRDALTAKNGMMIYNTTTNRVEKYEAGAWISTSAGSGGAGDVTGPASAVSGNIATFDGTTGKLLQDSGSSTADFAAASHTHATSDVTSGTFDDARIAESNVTQHEAALTIQGSQLTGTIDGGTY